MHINSEARVADHCSVYALSDVSESSFRQHCEHNHEELCDQRHALDVAIYEIGTAAQNAVFPDEEQRDEALFLFEAAKRSVQAWKAHQLRSVQQDKSRLDVLELLNNDTVLIVSDWAMKFLPQLYRESQQDWFGKRGISWHIAVVFRRVNGSEIQTQAFVHVVQSCSQDSTAVVLMMQHVLKNCTKNTLRLPRLIYGKTTQDATTALILSLLVVPLSSQPVSKLYVWISVTPKEVKERRTGWRPLAKTTSERTLTRATMSQQQRSGRCPSCYPAFNRRNCGASKDIWNKQAE